MSRPRNPPGAHGVIRVERIRPTAYTITVDGKPRLKYKDVVMRDDSPKLDGDKYRARTLYRFSDGKRRQVQKVGNTPSQAENRLKTALTTIEAPSQGEVSRRTKLDQLADAYLQLKADTGRSPRTVATYQHNADTIIKPMIGELTVGEATTMRLQRFITQVTVKHGHGAAKGCRSVLSGMFALAVRNDAITVNPVAGIAGIEKKRTHGATALPLGEVENFLATLANDPEMRRLDMVDLWSFMAYTGCRIGEALALRWSFVDLEHSLVTLGPSVSRIKGKGLIIYEPAKSSTSRRTITIPVPALAILTNRNETQPGNELDLVFPSMFGKLRDTSNTESDWRTSRDRLGYPGFSSHGFRKTVATALDSAGLSARDIADYLGHAHPSMTQDVYMARNTGSAIAAAALGSMFGVSSE